MTDVYVVMEEYNSHRPLAVCTTPEKAFDVARIYNLGGRGDRTAVVLVVTLDQPGPGMYLDVPAW